MDPSDITDPGDGSPADRLRREVHEGTAIWFQLIELESGAALFRALGSLDAPALRTVVLAAVQAEKLTEQSPQQVLEWLDREPL